MRRREEKRKFNSVAVAIAFYHCRAAALMKQFPLKQSPQQNPSPPCLPSYSPLAAAGADFAAIVARVCFKAQIASARQKYGQGKGNVVRGELGVVEKLQRSIGFSQLSTKISTLSRRQLGFPLTPFSFTHSPLSLSLSPSPLGRLSAVVGSYVRIY